MIRALAAGTVLGLAMFAAGLWAFVKGCPIFDPILDRDPIAPF
ncbi:hypothetical protein [Mycolicibacterium porcinum]|nr:hypothetical protein [Mycolicibacterium porcinum]